MTFINTCADVDDLGGGRFRHTQHIKPVAYDDNGTLRAIGSAFTASGKADRPHAVRAARLMTSVADDGMRRIHPTREEDRYVEIGAPYVKIGGVWRKMGFRGGMRAANRLTWASPQANMSIVHAGHYIKLEIELKRGYVPEDNLVAFPVGLNGLKRSGADILSDGRTVMSLRAPTMYDAANAMDTRAIDAKFVSLAGQPYYLMALPDLTGMSRPVIDPTLALQPDASSGYDLWLLAHSPTTNYGIAPIAIGGAVNSILFRFSLGGILSGATIDSASFFLTIAATRTNNRSGVHYELAAANRDWVEGTQNGGGNAAAGSSCYNAKHADGAGGITDPWAGGPGCRSAGTDHGTDVLVEPAYTANDPVGTEITGEFTEAGLTALEAAFGGSVHMIQGGGLNGGLPNTYTSDVVTAAYRPRLIIEYTLPGGGNIFQSAIMHSSLYGKTLVR